jgi:hypothetical protein
MIMSDSNKVCEPTCETFGKLDDHKKFICFGCQDFSAPMFAKQIMKAINDDDFEVDEDLLHDFNKFLALKEFTPTRKKQAVTFMDRVAVWLVAKLGTMTFFWICTVLVTIPLIWPKVMPIIQYVSSGYLQLLFLPLIMIASNLQQRRAEMREESNYKLSVKNDIQMDWLNFKIDRLQKQITELKGAL